MKILTASIFFILIFSSEFLRGQEAALQISNVRTQKEKVIKPNKRILVVTKSGERIKGRYQIIDDSNIIVNGTTINMKNIKKLRRNSLGVTIAKWTIISLGSFYAIGGLIVSSGIGTIVTTTIGSSLIAGGFLLPNFSNSPNPNNYYFTIVSITNQ